MHVKKVYFSRLLALIEANIKVATESYALEYNC